MENNEQRKDISLGGDTERQIQLVVNHPQTDEVTIDLGNVFQNMKLKTRIFAWVIILCLLLGIAVPAVMYQFSRPELTVFSVVTLRYETPKKVKEKDENGNIIWVIPEKPEYEMVSDLSAPDGSDLDLSQITSSYVLQTALNEVSLSQPVTVRNLRSNIRIQTVLTDESNRTLEMLQGLADANNADVYNRLQNAEMKYKNRFIVSLTNGFGEEDSRRKLELKDEELKLVLNRILMVYNRYLVRTYADLKLPEDRFSAIDVRSEEPLDSLDELQSGIQELLTYGEQRTDTAKNYRSWKTGRKLEDWMDAVKTLRTTRVDYLYAVASGDAIARDEEALLTGYRYLLRSVRSEQQKTDETIEETEKIIKEYKNDDIFISMQESDGAKTVRAATEYYNQLILQQAENYDAARSQQIAAGNYEDLLQIVEAREATPVTEEFEEELSNAVEAAQSLYGKVKEHMEELFDSSLYTTYEEFSEAQGREQSFLAASMRKMLIGAVLGLVIACGLWFLAGLAPEFTKNRQSRETGREGADK